MGRCPKNQAQMTVMVTLAVAVLYVVSVIGKVTAEGRFGTEGVGGPKRPLALRKRSFMDIQCKGAYDKNVFMQLDRVCDDCLNLYQEPSLYSLCRSNCFGSSYFKGCLDALLLNEEVDKYDEMIEVLGKK